MAIEQKRMRAPNSGRIVLAESVPLTAPLCIRIEPSQLCNFRCEFCPLSVEDYRKVQKNELINYDLFLSTVSNIKQSFGHVKHIMLNGMGEPFLHPRIADMVETVSREQICDSVEITTNASLLTPELSDALVSVGLSQLRISVDGLSSEDFQKYCDAKVDFDKYVKNIAYFFEHRGKTRVYTKILNYMVDTNERYETFLRTFGPISDMINVENLIELSQGIDFQEIAGKDTSFTQTMANTAMAEKTRICSMSFFTLQVNVDGAIQPCCAPTAPHIGNVADISLKKVWTDIAISFQRRMLDGIAGIPVCDICPSRKYWIQPEDVLDPYAQDLKNKYDAM